mmetsp:Transcript_22178/g.62184  ORF Transcript_22178/g.62184 Transcript_22178/m.62184 type:complete len:304 (+) Transcript_22178:72-983(+)
MAACEEAPASKKPKLDVDEVPIDRVLEVAKRAAREAGSAIRKTWYETTTAVKDTKSCSVDLVTETDQFCEEIVMKLIKEAFPEHEIIGEETAGAEKYNLTDAPTWTIDPIDGTTNFVHRYPQSCVIIAFFVGREVRCGVTYDPIADELFYATRGGGAMLESPNRVGPISPSGTTTIARALVNLEVGYGRDEGAISGVSTWLTDILRKGVRSVRMGGSTGMNLAYIACGRLDAAMEDGSWELGRGPKIWDFSAGALILAEAGGVTRDLASVDGGPRLDYMGRSYFAAATPALADEFWKVVKKAA